MNDYLRYAQDVIRMEALAVARMADRLDSTFNDAVQCILDCKGRVIVSGMGKSGLIGKKIAATFNSTGISSFFLHPAEALHGDLGLIRSDDVLLLISKSGHLQEMDTIIIAAKRMSVKILVLGGMVGSPLHQKADIFLDCSVETEACPNNLVPTSSATAAMVMGDALALALLKARNFSPEEFAAFHPAGFLGKRLLTRICDVHHAGETIPLVQANTPISEMLLEMTRKRLGCVIMCTPEGKVAGIFTDGDLRRLVEKGQDFMRFTAGDLMTQAPKTISQDALVDAALALMEKHAITQLASVDEQGLLVGVIHLHDILKTKLV